MKKLSIIAAAGLALCLATGPARADDSKENTAPEKKTLVLIDLDGPIAEVSNPMEIFGKKSKTLRDLTATIDKAATDPKVAGVLVKITSPSFGFSQAQTIHKHLMDYKKAGKPLYSWFDGAGLGSYMIASAADEVVMPEVGGLEVYGIGFDMFFFKDTLAKVGIEAQVVNTGKFKNAFEPFTHTAMSEGTKIQMGALIEDIFTEAVDAVAEGRKKEPAAIREAIMSGPYDTKDALAAGLITGVSYEDDFISSIKGKLGEGVEVDKDYSGVPKKKAEPINLFTLFAPPSAKKKSIAGSKIAVVYAIGGIQDGRKEKSPFGGGDNTITSEDMVETLQDVLDDDGVKAVVLRVDSPGGSAIASDRIWNRIQKIKAKHIPVVVSMGNVAASGGYYISMGADKIYAESGTITGSIGVIGAKMIFGKTYEMMGLHKDGMWTGKNTGLMDESRPWNESELALLQKRTDNVYDTFTSKVAAGRKIDQAKVKELGGGRVWSGKAAKENHLVDELGGLDEAIAAARQLASAPDAKLETFPHEDSFIEMIQKMMDVEASVSLGHTPRGLATAAPMVQMLEALVPPEQLNYVWTVVSASKDRPAVLCIMPYAVSMH